MVPWLGCPRMPRGPPRIIPIGNLAALYAFLCFFNHHEMSGVALVLSAVVLRSSGAHLTGWLIIIIILFITEPIVTNCRRFCPQYSPKWLIRYKDGLATLTTFLKSSGLDLATLWSKCFLSHHCIGVFLSGQASNLASTRYKGDDYFFWLVGMS